MPPPEKPATWADAMPGPDVLLIGGAGDTAESWQFQLDGPADRYRLTPRGGGPGGDHTDVIPWTCGRRTVVRPT